MDMLSLILQPIHLVIQVYIWIIIIAAVVSFMQLDPRQPAVEILNRLTQPAFQFIRQKIPFVVISGIDLSPLVLIVGLQFLSSLLTGGVLLALAQIIQSIIFSYIILIIIASVLSLVHIDPYNPIVSTINRLTYPPLQYVRQKLPFVVIGGIDLSPIVVILGLQLVSGVLTKLLLGL